MSTIPQLVTQRMVSQQAHHSRSYLRIGPAHYAA